MKFNWLFTLSVCISVGVLWTSMYAGFESVKVSYTQLAKSCSIAR